ncbi:hypothetical protein [Campylobacter sp.]|uniref:hypothetical protein n=1 Tax=Campylobacter sp. TaxID=205 RepID=UPI002AA6CA75|nr:hypothetical protein [Campylobacter sp.]MCI6565128.1 hypothetical protein [Campylobacter sp.]MCI6578918.1 hypothetical protein [Campylobacter sp.]
MVTAAELARKSARNSPQRYRYRRPTASAAALKLKIAHPAGAKQPADAQQKNLGALFLLPLPQI